MSTLQSTNLKNPSSGSNNIVLNADGTSTLTPSNIIKSGTAKAYNWNGLTTNTSLDFTGIPAWVKRVTVLLAGVSTNSTSPIQLQIGTGSTTYVSSGYTCGSGIFGSVNNTGINSYTAGFVVPSALAADLHYAELRLMNLSGNQWVCHGTGYSTGNPYTTIVNGTISLAAVLTAVRITTIAGTSTFDAGTTNILYEG
jgi:hypothetical protein